LVQAVAECFSVRPWCGGIDEWPALVGSLMSTIHGLLDSAGYPNEGLAILRKGLPPPFPLPQRESIGTFHSFLFFSFLFLFLILV
jgi:hypothetical protein